MALFSLGTPAAQAAAEVTGDGGIATPSIVGGQQASSLHGEVSFQFGGAHRCGGVLFIRNWVMTSADCGAAAAQNGAIVRTGSLDWTTGGQLVGIKRVVLNPPYTGETPKGDLALVELDRRVDMPTVPLAFGADSAGTPGIPTLITGWGRTCQDPTNPACAVAPNRLKQLATVVADPSRCYLGTTEAGAPVFDPATEVCFASASGLPEMACTGDSGSGLYRYMFGRWRLVAILVGDGDDLTPRANYCSTSPSGGQGTGIAERIAPWFPWIIRTLFSCDPAAAQELNTVTAKQVL